MRCTLRVEPQEDIAYGSRCSYACLASALTPSGRHCIDREDPIFKARLLSFLSSGDIDTLTIFLSQNRRHSLSRLLSLGIQQPFNSSTVNNDRVVFGECCDCWGVHWVSLKWVDNIYHLSQFSVCSGTRPNDTRNQPAADISSNHGYPQTSSQHRNKHFFYPLLQFWRGVFTWQFFSNPTLMYLICSASLLVVRIQSRWYTGIGRWSQRLYSRPWPSQTLYKLITISYHSDLKVRHFASTSLPQDENPLDGCIGPRFM